MISSPTPLVASSLPQSTTPFIGRQRELDELCARLSNPQVRMITVQGIGGMGKTRLAIEAAKRVQANFADGATFVLLTALPSPDQIVLAICAALKLSLSQGDAESQLAGLIAALHNKELLLILDNLEHLLATPSFVTHTTAIIGALIKQTERLKVLITSREALRLSNETTYRLDGLSGNQASADALSDAISLFIQSAGHAKVDFQLRPADESTVRRICQLVSGMPLGIELAASWISLLTPDEIAAELERNLDLLTTDEHDISPRHRSLNVVLDQSWEMLPTSERDVIERLSVFRGSFRREMAAQVADASLIALAQLATKSFVRRTENNRYDLHELMRQYAHSRLVQRGADEEAHRKHAVAFTAYAEREVMRFYNPQSHLVRKQFEFDLGNFRAALAWCSDSSLPDTNELGLRLAVALVRFYRDLPNWREGYDWIVRFLARQPATLAPYLRARAQLGIAHFTHAWADYAIAVTHYEAALATFDQVEAPNREVEWYIAWALGQSEGCYFELGQLDQATAVAEESLRRFKQLGDEWAIGMITWQMAILSEAQQAYARAAQLAEESFAIFQRLNATSSLSFVAIVRGNVARAQGDFATAEQHYLTAVVICRSSDNQDGMAWTLQLVGEAILIQNDAKRAIPYLLEALTLRNTMGHQYAVCEVMQGLALAFAQLQDDAFATRLLSAATRDQRGDTFLLIAQQLRPLYEQTRAELQKRLGSAWTSEWVLGQVAATIELIAACRAKEEAIRTSHANAQATSVGRQSFSGEAVYNFDNDFDTIVRTRLNPPRLRNDSLHRPRLERAISNALGDVRLVLIAAPAGFGKTTLLASTLQHLSDLPIAWLSVAPEDDGLVRFLRILEAALRSLAPSFMPIATSLLASDMTDTQNALAVGRTWMSELINELFDLDKPCAIILDDLHAVTDSAIYATLDFLIDRLPPMVTLVIATRHDPPVALAQLRARRELLEIRLEELRFTPEEAKTLLNQHLGLALAAAQIESLTKRTEGWATGMTLIANSLERIETPAARAAFLEQFARSNRYIFDYLADAVLNREDRATHDFLLATSILDELTPEACAAVSGRSDAANVLDRLYRRNLFLVALDGLSANGTAYRYNELFREFLRGQLSRLPAEHVRDLHVRAGKQATRSEARIDHFVQAQAWDEAATTIAQVGESLIEQGWLALVGDWIAKLPAQVLEEQPRLAYLMGICKTLEWELVEAQRWLRRAYAGFVAAGDVESETSTLVYLATCLSAMNDAETNAVVEQILLRRLQAHQRIQLLGVQSIQAFDQADFQRCLAYVEEAIAVAEMRPTRPALNALVFSVHSVAMRQPGAILLIERLARLLASHSKDNLKLTGFAALWRAWAHCWRGEWDVALQCGSEAMAISRQLGDSFSISGELSFLIPVCTAFSDGDAEATLQALLDAIQVPIRAGGAIRTGWRESWIAGFLYEIGRVRWHQGRLTEAQAIYQQALERINPQERSFSPSARALLRALLLISANKLAEADRLLHETLAQNHITPYHALHGQSTLAYIALLQGKEAVAMSAFAPVLDLYAQQGTPGHVRMIGPRLVEPLLKLALIRNVQGEFVRGILRAMGKLEASVAALSSSVVGKAIVSTTFRVPNTGETLTEREIEVLRLVARGADNPTIAEELILSIHTVKSHVAHILGKLGVPSRTVAALRAKELGIV